VSGPPGRCPGCGGGLAPVEAGAEEARRCPGCGGLFLDPATLARLTAEAVEPGAALPEGVPPSRQWSPPRVRPDEVRYRRCPDCGDLMNRVNFARVSGVVLDVCRGHGAFLDAGELERIRAFLAQGGARRYAVARGLAEERERERARRERDRPGPVEPSGLAGLEGLDLLFLLLP
jgi:Zn-finger nucleic acid-binding protein